MVKREFLLGSLMAILATLCWSSTPLFMKYLMKYMNSWTMNMYRYGVAAVIYLVFLLYYVKKGALTQGLYRRSLLPVGVNIAFQILWAESVYHLEPGLIAIFIRMSIVWGAILSFLLFADERGLLRKFSFWLGIGLAFASFMAMSFSQFNLKTSSSLRGLIILFFCAILWGSYPVLVKWRLREVDPRVSFSLICVNTTVGLVIFGILKGTPQVIFTLPPKIGIILVLSAIVGIALSHPTYYYALQTLGVVATTNITMTGAFYTLVLSHFIFGEVITLPKVIFGSGIIVGAAIITFTRHLLAKSE
jgi:drug/metabolite transporter (DMT)-like permease